MFLMFQWICSNGKHLFACCAHSKTNDPNWNKFFKTKKLGFTSFNTEIFLFNNFKKFIVWSKTEYLKMNLSNAPNICSNYSNVDCALICNYLEISAESIGNTFSSSSLKVNYNRRLHTSIIRIILWLKTMNHLYGFLYS